MNEHEKWLSRQVYHETFSTAGTAFPSWRGIPNRCNCGCAEVWYDRLSTTNWWATFNPAAYIPIVRELVCVVLALHGVLWHLPPVIWAWLQIMRTGYKREVMNRIQPGIEYIHSHGCRSPVVVRSHRPADSSSLGNSMDSFKARGNPNDCIVLPDTGTSCGCTLDFHNNIGNRHLNERLCVHIRRRRVHLILRQSCRRYHSYRDWRVCAI